MKSRKKIRMLQFSDMHLGKVIYKKERKEEAIETLREIAQISRDNECDVFCNGGDTYDVFNPPSWAVKGFNDFLSDMGLPGIIVSGNHDSRSKLEESESYYKMLNIELVTSYGEHNIRRIDLGDKEIVFAGMPWIPTSSVMDFSEDTKDDKKKKYSDIVSEMTMSISKNLEAEENAPKVLVTHAMFDSAIAEGDERALTIMDTYTIPQEVLSEGIDYTAVGHIHRGQKIPKAKCPANYSGSIRCETFGDKASDKYVLLVDFELGDDNKWRYVSDKKVFLVSPKKLMNVSVGIDDEVKDIDVPTGNVLVKIKASLDKRFNVDFGIMLKENKQIVHVDYESPATKRIVEEEGAKPEFKSISSVGGMIRVYSDYYLKNKGEEIDDDQKKTVEDIFSRFHRER